MSDVVKSAQGAGRGLDQGEWVYDAGRYGWAWRREQSCSAYTMSGPKDVTSAA